MCYRWKTSVSHYSSNSQGWCESVSVRKGYKIQQHLKTLHLHDDPPPSQTQTWEQNSVVN